MRKPQSNSAGRFRRAALAAAVAAALLPGSASALILINVTSAADSGPGTLRQAIIDANANCGLDTNIQIQFFVGTGPFVISLGSPLPPLSCGSPFNVFLDGFSQPGSVANTLSVGSDAVIGPFLDGSGITSGSSCGITWNQTPGQGVLTVRNMGFVAFSPAASSTGICANDMNLFGSEFFGNGYGVRVRGGGNANIGTGSPSGRNTFHNNSAKGIEISYAGTVDVNDNYVGTLPSGTSASPNGLGVYVAGSGPVMIVNNVISGNSFQGIYLDNQATATMASNSIGVGATGGAVPNQSGVTVINTFIPSTVMNFTGNVISGNSNGGISIPAGDKVAISGGSIFANGGGKNIDLGIPGAPLLNDFQDVDGGSNQGQNHPVISSVIQGGGNTMVNFSFNSTPGKLYTFEVFSNSAVGTPGGETFQTSSVNQMTDANGDLFGVITIGALVDNISMTARDQVTKDTSEFSPAVAVTLTPAVTVSSSSLAFGNVPTGSTSPNLTSTLTSSGTGAWQITALGSPPSCYGGPICYGGAEFTCMTTCQTFTPYNPTQSCTLTANFHPTILGPQSTTIQFCDNAAGSPRDIVLSGTGVAPSAFALSPAAFDFGNVPVGSQSPRAFFTLQNPGASPLGYTTATSGPFSIVGTTCTNPVPAGGSCDFDLIFVPDAPGIVMGSFTVSPSSGSPASSTLMGNGTVAPQLSLPSSIDFQFTLGGIPQTQTLTLQNTGLATLDISSITISGPFTLVNNCPTSLAPGASCTLILGFAAPSAGAFDGTLTIVTNAPGGSRAIALHGLSQPRAVPFLEVTPNEIGFGDQALGTASDGELVKIKNIGGAPAIFDSIVTSPDFVILRHTCIGPLDTGASCEAEVAIRALGYGTRSGKFTVNSNAENSPSQVNIFGTGCRSSGLTLGRLGISRGCR